MDLQLPAVLAANHAYRQTEFATTERTARPQRHLVILACMDTRLDLFRALGLQIGDAHILRNAGGRASIDVIRSLVVSAHLLGTREIGVIHHTKCGLEGLTEDDVAARTGVTGMEFLTFADVDQSVRDDVDAIRSSADLPAEVAVWGAVYDVDTGEVRVVAQPD